MNQIILPFLFFIGNLLLSDMSGKIVQNISFNPTSINQFSIQIPPTVIVKGSVFIRAMIIRTELSVARNCKLTKNLKRS